MPSWVEIQSFYHPVEAELAKSFLEAHDIPVFLRQEGAARALGVYVGPFGTIHLLVPSNLVTEARLLLRDFLRGRDASAS